MIKLIYLTISLMLLASCGMNTNDDSATGIERDETPLKGDAQKGNTRISTDEEQIVESRFLPQIDLENENNLSRTQAEHLVRNRLNIKDKDDTLVFYDHEEDGKYIIRVLDPMNNNKDDGTKWYSVDTQTAKIEEFHK